MEKSFLEYYDFYEGVCKERLHLQGQNMQVMTVCKCALLHFMLCPVMSIVIITLEIQPYANI